MAKLIVTFEKRTDIHSVLSDSLTAEAITYITPHIISVETPELANTCSLLEKLESVISVEEDTGEYAIEVQAPSVWR